MTPIEELRQTMKRLRQDCPWDREQTHESLTRCLIDECSELLDTIDRRDYPHMREELGDVLIQVVFHALIAEEGGHFDFDDVARDINAKLIRRHPHVFGDHAKLSTAGEVISKWEDIKAGEKKNGPAGGAVFKPQPPRLPALMLAEAVLKQIEKKQLPADGAVDGAAIARRAAGLDEAAAGRLLFELAGACRRAGIDPETALRKECARVMQHVEAAVQARA